MSSTAERLKILNGHRERIGLKPLKTWKESSAKLDTAINAILTISPVEPEYEFQADDAAQELERDTEALEEEGAERDTDALDEAATPAADAAQWIEENEPQDGIAPDPTPAKKPAKAKKKDEPTEEPKYIMLTAICREIGKLPKVGRAMARRYAPKEGYEWLVQFEGNWRFPIEKKEEVITLLNKSKKT